MSQLRHTAVIFALTALSACSVAQPAAEHTQHHAKEAANKALTPQEAVVDMDAKMKVMREMREKIKTAKTPQERKALMANHMKTMHEGMSMMEKMDATGAMGAKSSMAEHHMMMNKRMEMMTNMMHMMMDQLPAPAVP